MATRKSFNESESNIIQSIHSDEFIQNLIAENERLQKQNSKIMSEEDKEGKNLWGYSIVLSKANDKYSQQTAIDFGHNGQIYNVKFGEPCEVPCSVVEMLELHIKENTRKDGGRLNTTNIHYHFSKVREIWR